MHSMRFLNGEIIIQIDFEKRPIYNSPESDIHVLDFSLRHDFKKLTWQKIISIYSYPNVSKMVDLLLVLPSSTASVERAFSQLKLLKTSSRSRLTNRTLNSLLMIKLESLDVEVYDPYSAIELWYSASDGGRRPAHVNKRSESGCQCSCSNG
ncbi:unnamed protein product [Owenia fusiformis]|uniref:HAT C-terminal dimerisation domain-containing protein n=1 Tax=Owenia fusiformis TaxID=6347 RepID=A0A8S4PUZ7_OWEFU|nr:unnamed protein product [Owenia fusiformis]